MITLDKNIILSICTQLLRHTNAQVSLIGEPEKGKCPCCPHPDPIPAYLVPTHEVDTTVQRLIVEETGWSMEEFRTALYNFKDDIRDHSKCVLCGKVIDAPHPEGSQMRCLSCLRYEEKGKGR